MTSKLVNRTPFEGVYSDVSRMELSSIIEKLHPCAMYTIAEKQAAMFSLIYHYNPTLAVEKIMGVALNGDDELSILALKKFDPLLQSRRFFPHPHRMELFWREMRRRKPQINTQINEAAKLTREYCRMWCKLPAHDISFDSYGCASPQTH